MGRRLVPAIPRSSVRIETLAEDIIKACQPGVLEQDEPFDIERFFDNELEEISRVTCAYRKLQDGIYGYTDADLMECILSLDLAEDPMQRKFYRSTMAHEVGHAVRHVRDYRMKKAVLRFIHEKDHLRAYRQEDIITYKNPEWQAWRFAGAILMPATAFERCVKSGYSELDLSTRFDVNPAFVRTRLRALKLKTI